MTKSRTEELFPTLAPLPGKIGRGAVRGAVVVLKAIGRAGKRIWKPTLAILLLLIVCDGAATLIAGRRLAAKIAEIKSNGGYVSCAELAGPPVPTSENGAVLYEKAFKLLPERPPLFEKSACELLMDPDERAQDPTLWSRAQSDVAKCAKSFALVVQAQKMPRWQFEINWEDGLRASFPHHDKLKQLAYLLAANALIKARNGDATGAIRSLEVLFATQESIKHEPSMRGICMRAWIIVIGQNALTQVLEMVRVPESDAKRLASRLAGISVTSDLPNALRGTRACVIDACKEVHSVGGNPIESSDFGPCPTIERIKWDIYFSPLGRPLTYRDDLRILQCWDEIIRMHGRPYRKIDEASIARINTLTEHAGPLACLLYSDYLRDHATAESADAKLTGSRLILALNVYKQRHKAYPDTLAKLRSSINWAPSDVDPFSGKDFVYHRVGNGFTLYSLGPNQKDDGGKPMQSAEGLIRPGDVVWKTVR